MGPDTEIGALIAENVELLRSGLRVMQSIPASLYCEGHDRARDGGVGRHFRHIIEFYEQLVTPDGHTVHYESRRRDALVESDVEHAAVVVQRIIDALELLSPTGPDATLTVVTEVLGPNGSAVVTRSSLERELAVLASHTIHHYAIIAHLLRGHEVELPEDFGVAPSTLRYVASRSS